MSLLDEAKLAQRARGPACRVGLLLNTNTGAFHQEIVDLLAAVERQDIFATTAAAIFKEHKLNLTDESIRHHLARKCLCP